MKILIVDPNESLRDLLEMMLEMHFNCIVRQAATLEQGMYRIKKHADLDGVICGRDFGVGNGAIVLRFLREHRPGVPFALCSSIDPAEDPLFRDDPPDAHLRKPGVIEPLKCFIRERVCPQGEPVGDPEYRRIHLKTLLRLGISSADLYAKLPGGEYSRVYQVGDRLSLAGHPTEYLYVRGEDGPKFLARVAQEVLGLSETKKTGFDRAIEISAGALEVIGDFNRRFRFDGATLDLARSSVEVALKGLRESQKLSQLLDSMRVDSARYLPSHSSVLAFLSCGIAGLMGWSADASLQALATASFLHDLALGAQGPLGPLGPLSNDELARIRTWAEVDQRRSELGVSKVNAVLYHGEEAAKLAEEIPGLAPETALIIRQHHERPDGAGFPLKLTFEDLSPLSAVFIVAHDLVSFQEATRDRFDIADFMRSQGEQYREGTFRKLAQVVAHACVTDG